MTADGGGSPGERPEIEIEESATARLRQEALDETTTSSREPGDSASSEARAQLVQIYGDGLGKSHRLHHEVTIGREGANEIVLAEHDVSRFHARLYEEAGRAWVLDLGSTNGTWVNGARIADATPLASGDRIKLGSTIFKFLEGGDVEALYHEEIYRLTITDGLTGLPNRRFFDEFLEREVARSLRHHRPLSLAMLDVDAFKTINDEHGHLAGDRVLVGVAEQVKKTIRREDLAARFAGDEIAIVLTETECEGAAAHCERIRRRVRKTAFDGVGGMRVTISSGVVSADRPIEPQRLLALADERLYEAKRDGRDRVVARALAAGEG